MVAVMTDPADPLTEAAPALDVGDIEDILARSWEVRGALTPLHGERDLNFRVDDPSGPTYVLKIQNPADPAEVVGFQTAAARHIRWVAPDLPISDVVLTRSGEEWTTTTDATPPIGSGRAPNHCANARTLSIPTRRPSRNAPSNRSLRPAVSMRSAHSSR